MDVKISIDEPLAAKMEQMQEKYNVPMMRALQNAYAIVTLKNRAAYDGTQGPERAALIADQRAHDVPDDAIEMLLELSWAVRQAMDAAAARENSETPT